MMLRLQAVVQSGKNLLRQRIVHPQNERLEQVANQRPSFKPTNILHGAGNGAAVQSFVKVSPKVQVQLATFSALNVFRRHNQMKLLLYQLRRPFRSGHALQRGSTIASAASLEQSELYDRLDDHYEHLNLLQSQLTEANHRQDREQSDRSDTDLSSSSVSRLHTNQLDDAYEGAYSGIMSIFDDPKKAGKRQFCGATLDSKVEFQHRAQLRGNLNEELDDKSEVTSRYLHSCEVQSSQDSVKQDALAYTRGLIEDMRYELFSDQASDDFSDENEYRGLAISIEVLDNDVDQSSYGVLSSSEVESQRSQGQRRGLLV